MIYRLLAPALLLPLFLAVPPPADAGERALLVDRGSVGPEGRLEIAGEEVTVPLPAGGRLTVVARLDSGGWGAGGWIAAGVRAGGGEAELLLVADRGDGPAALPLPAAAGQPHLRQEPVLLTDGGRLAGLAWLEGDHRGGLAVRAAGWDGAGWTAPVTVAPPGPGSQLALAGVALPDGGRLLVWAAFDGEDDEILYSRGTAQGVWSEPRRVAADNRVPDITPALLATGDGAVAAWSRFSDGHYRLFLSRLSDDGWSEPRVVGPPGSLYPVLEPAPEATAEMTGSIAGYLLYRTALPRGWELLGLGRGGEPTKRLRLADSGAETEPPLLTVDRASGRIELRWPASDRRLDAGTEAAWEVLP